MVYWSLLISGSIYVCIYASPSIPSSLMINNLLFDQVTETIRPQVEYYKRSVILSAFLPLIMQWYCLVINLC